MDAAVQFLQLPRAEHETAHRRLPASVDEVIRAEARELDLRLLDREQMLDRVGQRPEAVLQRGLELTELVLGLRERKPAMDIDAERLRADVLLRDICVDARV